MATPRYALLDLPPLAAQNPHGPVPGFHARQHGHSGLSVAIWAVLLENM